MAGDGIDVVQQPVVRPLLNKKESRKVPKKENKAKREKQKREHLNDLFLELDQVLEPASMRQDNGKASILVGATHLLRELLAQVKSLEKENAVLLNESHYVTAEKNELKDEKDALETEVERLQNELHQRKNSDSVELFQNIDVTRPAQAAGWHDGMQVAAPVPLSPTSTPMPMQQLPIGAAAVLVFPVAQDLHPHTETGAAAAPLEPPSEVRRPHPRYPCPSDTWSMDLLSRSHRIADEAQHRKSNGSSVLQQHPNTKPSG